jgi:hypothetical protein
VDVAELFLLLALVVFPPVLGVVAALMRKPWWWAALAAVVVVMVAALAPTPEAGEPRVAAGDLVFLLVVALWVAGLAWLGSFLGRKFWTGRTRSTATPSP